MSVTVVKTFKFQHYKGILARHPLMLWKGLVVSIWALIWDCSHGGKLAIIDTLDKNTILRDHFIIGSKFQIYPFQKIWLVFSGGSRIFLGGGRAPTPKVSVLTYYFGRKLHENERIWTPRGEGGASLALPLDPPLVLT